MDKEEKIIRDILDDISYYEESWLSILKDEFIKLLRMKWESELESLT